MRCSIDARGADANPTPEIFDDLKAIALNCTLKADPASESSTDAMIAVLKKALADVKVEATVTVRAAVLNILPGVTSNEGKGDAWPALRKRILQHDILIFGGPIWMGQISSIAKRVLERVDAFLEETDEAGGCRATGRSPLPRSSATKTALIFPQRNFFRR